MCTLGVRGHIQMKNAWDVNNGNISVKHFICKIFDHVFLLLIDRGAEGEQDSEASTTRKAMVGSASTNAEEMELDKSTKPVSKSIFSFSFARSVPGRTDDSSTEPKSETAQLQANQKTSGNTAPIDKMNLRQSSPQKGDSAQKQRQPSTESFNAAESTEKETGQPKQKEVSFFDKLFKQGDKSKQQNGHRGDVKTAGSQDLTAADREAGELIHRLDNVHQYLVSNCVLSFN